MRLPLIATVTLVVAGCFASAAFAEYEDALPTPEHAHGTNPEAQAVIQSTRAYIDGYLHGDPQAGCSHLTVRLRRFLANAFKGVVGAPSTCVKALKLAFRHRRPKDLAEARAERRKLRVGDVILERGRARIWDGVHNSTILERVSGRWLVDGPVYSD